MGLFGKSCQRTDEGILEALIEGYDLKNAMEATSFHGFRSQAVQRMAYGVRGFREITGKKNPEEVPASKYAKKEYLLESAVDNVVFAYRLAVKQGDEEVIEYVKKCLFSPYILKCCEQWHRQSQHHLVLQYFCLVNAIGVPSAGYPQNAEKANKLLQEVKTVVDKEFDEYDLSVLINEVNRVTGDSKELYSLNTDGMPAAAKAEYRRTEFDNGDVYEGELKGSVKHGKGKYTWADGEYYDGDWVDGKRTGKGILHYNNGAEYAGDFVDGKKTGKGTYHYASGAKYDGEWKDGKKHGHGIFTFDDGATLETNWVNDLKQGAGTYVFAGGNRSEVVFKDDKKVESPPSSTSSSMTKTSSGFAVEIKRTVFDNGDVYEGEYVDGKKHGHGKYTSKKGWVYEGDFQGDTMTGCGKVVFANGGYYEGGFLNGKRNGTGKAKLTNGNFYEGEYQNDNRHGHGKLTLKDGDVYDGDFKDDKMNGKGECTLADGTHYYGQWKDGKRNGLFLYKYPNGDSLFILSKNDSTHDCLGNEYRNGVRKIGIWDGDVNFTHAGVRSGMKNPERIVYKTGSVYYGDTNDTSVHGYGQLDYADGDIWVGRWNNGSMVWGAKYTASINTVLFGNYDEYGYLCGEGRVLFPKALYEGGLDHNEYHDEGVYYDFATGYKIRSRWEHGHCVEVLEAWDADGDAVAEGMKSLLKRDDFYTSLVSDSRPQSSVSRTDNEEGEQETFNSIFELYDTYKNPYMFANPHDKDIFYGCRYMEYYYNLLKDSFDETDYGGANKVLCEVLCVSFEHFIDFITDKFDFIRGNIAFEEWLLTAMNYAAEVFAATDDTTGINTPIALLNLGYYLYRREVVFVEAWLLPYLSCLYGSGAYDGGLGMGALWIARHYMYHTETVEIDTEDTDPVLSFWEETYGDDLKAALAKNASLYCDGYIYTTKNEEADRWESFDSVHDLLLKIRVPSLFIDSRDRYISNSCEYLGKYIDEAREEFDGSDTAAANEIIGSLFSITLDDLCNAMYEWDKQISYSRFEDYLHTALYCLSSFNPDDPDQILVPLANVVYYMWKQDSDVGWFSILCHIWAELGGECDESLLWFKRMRDCGDCNGTADDPIDERHFGEILDRHSYTMGSNHRLYMPD